MRYDLPAQYDPASTERTVTGPARVFVGGVLLTTLQEGEQGTFHSKSLANSEADWALDSDWGDMTG